MRCHQRKRPTNPTRSKSEQVQGLLISYPHSHPPEHGYEYWVRSGLMLACPCDQTLRIHVQCVNASLTEVYVHSHYDIDISKLGTLEWDSFIPSIEFFTTGGEYRNHQESKPPIIPLGDAERKEHAITHEHEWVELARAQSDPVEIQQQLVTTCGGGVYINPWNGSSLVLAELIKLGARPSYREVFSAVQNAYEEIVSLLLEEESVKSQLKHVTSPVPTSPLAQHRRNNTRSLTARRAIDARVTVLIKQVSQSIPR